MTEKIQFLYCLKHIKHRKFSLIISKDSTVKDVLALISKKRNEDYSTMFYLKFEMDIYDLVIDYIEDDPDYIFVVSLDSIPPSSSLYEQLISVDSIPPPEKEPPKPSPKLPPPKLPPPKPSPKLPPPKPSPKLQPIKPSPKLQPQNPEAKIAPKFVKPPIKAKPVSHAAPAVMTPSHQYTPKVEDYDIKPVIPNYII